MTSKCNIAAARSAPRGVTINFGATHERDGSGHELEVELLHRVMLDPTAAARLQQLLTKLAADYEARYQQSK